MAIATLSVDLVAQLARFEADMGRAARIAENAANRMDRAFVGVGAVFAGSLLADAAKETVRQLVTLVPALIDSVARFQDLEETTGANAEALASFQTAADVSGKSIDQIAGFMVKLTGTLSKTNTETKGAGAALKALGIDLEQFRRLAPEQQFQTLADRLNKFRDGAGKTAIAIALLGKSGAEALPFFKELAESGQSQVRLTAEQIRLADAYADRNAKLRSELRQAAQVAALQMVPALSALGEEMLKAAQAAIGLDGATDRLQNSGLREFAENGAVAAAILVEALVGVIKVAGVVGGAFRAAAADIEFLGEIGKRASPGGWARLAFDETARKELSDALQKRNDTVAAFNKQLDDLLNYDGTRVSRRLQVQFSPEGRAASSLGQDPLELARRGRPVGGQPQLNFRGAGDEGAAAKAAREAREAREAELKQGLKALEALQQSEREAFDAQGRFHQAEYDAGLLSLAAFYDGRELLDRRALNGLKQNLAAQVEQLEKFKRTLKVGSKEEIDTQTKIDDIKAKAARADQQYTEQLKLGNLQKGQSFAQLSARVQDFAAEILRLQGDEAGAAELQAQQAIAAARRLAAQTSGQPGLSVDVAGYERALTRSNQLAAAQRNLGDLTERASIQEERFLVAADARGASLEETERGVFAIRSAALAQLGELLAKTEALAVSAGPDSPIVKFAEQLRLQFERAAASVDPTKLRFDAAAGEGAKVLVDGLRQAVLEGGNLRDIIADIDKRLSAIVLDELVFKPLEQQLRGLLKDGVGSILGVFGGSQAQPLGGAVAGITGGAADAGQGATLATLTASAAGTEAALLGLGTTAISTDAGLLVLADTMLEVGVTAYGLDTALIGVTAAAELAAEALFSVAVSAATSGGGGGDGDGEGAAAFADFVVSLFAAKGAGFAHGGQQLQMYAKGDVFNSPTMFRFANGGGFSLGVMGEAGPEAVVPLKRGANGALGVAMHGGAARQTVVNAPITINVQGGSVDRRTLRQIGDEAYRGAAAAHRRNG